MILSLINDGKYIDLKKKKITLEDDEKQENIREFCNQFLVFLEENSVNKVVIKKRAKKGNFAGGATTFKMEALIQLNPFCDVELISAQTIASFEKKNIIEFPEKLMKYQEQSFLTAFCQS
jgi:hypothetical protein